jgi:hypothetical protein
MDLMDDQDLKKSVIDQMMGELDDVTADSLKRKPEGSSGGGVEIAITVSPKTEGEMKEELGDGECMDEDCEDPMHDHSERDKEKEPDGDYISQLLKKLG